MRSMYRYPTAEKMARYLAIELFNWNYQLIDQGGHHSEMYIFHELLETKGRLHPVHGQGIAYEFGIDVLEWTPFKNLHQATDCAFEYEDQFGDEIKIGKLTSGWGVALGGSAEFDSSLSMAIVKVMYKEMRSLEE